MPTPPLASEAGEPHGVSADELEAVNRVVDEATLSWRLPERVRRLALPSLRYADVDLAHMTVVLLDAPDGSGAAVAAWEPARWPDAPHGARAVLVHGLYVVPRWQRTGLGGALLEFAGDWARARGADGVTVRAWRESEAYFRARGWTPLGATDGSSPYPRRMWKPFR